MLISRSATQDMLLDTLNNPEARGILLGKKGHIVQAIPMPRANKAQQQQAIGVYHQQHQQPEKTDQLHISIHLDTKGCLIAKAWQAEQSLLLQLEEDASALC